MIYDAQTTFCVYVCIWFCSKKKNNICKNIFLFSLISQGVVAREPFPLPAVPAPSCIDTSESYYEEAQPYGETFNGEKTQQSIDFFTQFHDVSLQQCKGRLLQH